MYNLEPKNIKLPAIETDDYLLTNLIWYNPETGVRTKTNGVINDDFKLIQHDWRDWQFACEIILKGLKKGWSVEKIADVMEFMQNKRWNIKQNQQGGEGGK